MPTFEEVPDTADGDGGEAEKEGGGKSSPQTADSLREKGNALFKSGDFPGAMEAYTEALSLGGEKLSAESRAKCYSNRSAAAYKLGELTSAVADANATISALPTFWKGYSRLAASLYKKGEISEAEKAYQDGLAICSGEGKLKLEGELRRFMIRKQKDGSNQAGGASVAAQSKSKIPFYVRFFVVLNALLYLQPFSPMLSSGSYNYVLLGSIFKYVLALSKHGRPRWASEYGIRLATDISFHYAFFTGMLRLCRPNFLGLFPLVTPDIYLLAKELSITNPSLASSLGRVVKPAARLIYHTDDMQALHTQIIRVNAMAEIGLGIFLIIELFTPLRNFFGCMMMWQFIRMRYMLSDDVKLAFRQLHTTVNPYLLKVPIVSHAWKLVVKGAAWAVKLPEPGERPSSCSVM